jgi:choline dehydrogenase-like flavoprotein
MLVDARSLPDKSVIDTDVCIVGAGPAGITVARELNALAFRVCVVESGGTQPDPATQSLSALTFEGSDLMPAARDRRRQFGGNANLWSVGRRPPRSLVRYLPLDAIDFTARPWLPHSGWPFRRSALDPYYARAHAVAGLGAYAYEPPDRPRSLDDADDVRTSVEWFSTGRPFTSDALEEFRRSGNVSVLTNASAGSLRETPDGARIEHLRIDCLNGTRHTVTAKVFVLAAGGIENPRLLLLSNERSPAGVGNQHDVVGRYFMDHLHVRGSLVPSDRGVFDSAGPYDVRALRDGRVMGCKLNLTPAVMESERLMNSALKLDARIDSRPLSVFAGTYTRLMVKHRQLRPSFFGWSELASPARRYAEFATHLQIELAPVATNRVMLSAQRDGFGRPLPLVHWRWDELSRRSVQSAARLLTASLARARVGRLEMPDGDPPPLPNALGINHHIGATRIHADPRYGVVDANCQVHGVSNLFIAGSSVFPTGGYANPTLTIIALAIRLADRVRDVMRPSPCAVR